MLQLIVYKEVICRLNCRPNCIPGTARLDEPGIDSQCAITILFELDDILDSEDSNEIDNSLQTVRTF
jgi:hypothetical protein